jgi:hypothetical protein
MAGRGGFGTLFVYLVASSRIDCEPRMGVTRRDNPRS